MAIPKTKVALVLIIVMGGVAGLFSFVHIYYPLALSKCGGGFGCPNERLVVVTNITFATNLNVLNFTLNDPAPASTGIVSVTVNQIPCIGAFPSLKEESITYESCIVSGRP